MAYNSSLTSQQMEQRILQGYYDDIIQAGIEGGVFEQDEITKSELDLELAKRIKSEPQNGRILLGKIDKNNGDSMFLLNKDSLIEALNDISFNFENEIKSKYLESNQTEFYVRFISGGQSSALPGSDEDYVFSRLTYYIDVTCQQLGSTFEYEAGSEVYNEYKDSVGYVIYNPSNPCIRILKKFDRDSYTVIDQCPQEAIEKPDVPIIIDSGIAIETNGYDIEDLMTGQNISTIGSLVIEKMSQYSSGSARMFIVKYTAKDVSTTLNQEIFCRVIECQYSSGEPSGTYRILVENGNFEKGIIYMVYNWGNKEFTYSFTSLN